MPLLLIDALRALLKQMEGKETDILSLRKELKIDPTDPAWNGIRMAMLRLANEKLVRPSGRRDGVYKVIRQVEPVQVFGVDRERRPPFELMFPRDFETQMEMDFANDVVVREGDLILISGLSNYGKTSLCMNFLAENIDKHPTLMGNEYTTLDQEPTPRFLNRLDSMDWVNWTNDGKDAFDLIPVREDYAEHIVKDKINIIDWINVESGEHFLIGNILEGIKKPLGKGVAIVAIQKAPGAEAGRGGQFTKDFCDCELLIDKYGDLETLLTIGKVKEYVRPVVGKSYAFSIMQGVKIMNFRPVKKCAHCGGKGFTTHGRCENCDGKKFTDA